MQSLPTTARARILAFLFGEDAQFMEQGEVLELLWVDCDMEVIRMAWQGGCPVVVLIAMGGRSRLHLAPLPEAWAWMYASQRLTFRGIAPDGVLSASSVDWGPASWPVGVLTVLWLRWEGPSLPEVPV